LSSTDDVGAGFWDVEGRGTAFELVGLELDFVGIVDDVVVGLEVDFFGIVDDVGFVVGLAVGLVFGFAVGIGLRLEARIDGSGVLFFCGFPPLVTPRS